MFVCLQIHVAEDVSRKAEAVQDKDSVPYHSVGMQQLIILSICPSKYLTSIMDSALEIQYTSADCVQTELNK